MMGLKLKSFNFNFQMEKKLEYSCMERIKSAQIALFLRERLKEKWKKRKQDYIEISRTDKKEFRI